MGPGKADWGNKPAVRVQYEPSGTVEQKPPAPVHNLDEAVAILVEMGVIPLSEQPSLPEDGGEANDADSADKRPVPQYEQT